MSFAQHLYQMVDIIANYAVKEHYTDDGADCDQLEEIKRVAKDLSKPSLTMRSTLRYLVRLFTSIRRRQSER